jgi:hypothetical protein
MEKSWRSTDKSAGAERSGGRKDDAICTKPLAFAADAKELILNSICFQCPFRH